MRRSDHTHRMRRPRASRLILLAALAAAVWLGAPSNGRSSEMVTKVRPVAPAATVWMLSAPHTGKRICEVPASTPVKFITRASHGPHHYARVEVLDGDCAGKQGYVPWTTLEPEAQTE